MGKVKLLRARWPYAADYMTHGGRFLVTRIANLRRGDNWHVVDGVSGNHRFVGTLKRVREEIDLMTRGAGE